MHLIKGVKFASSPLNNPARGVRESTLNRRRRGEEWQLFVGLGPCGANCELIQRPMMTSSPGSCAEIAGRSLKSEFDASASPTHVCGTSVRFFDTAMRSASSRRRLQL